ncbi:MAG: T9SS type A sorting domain-containing protein [Crocinitomix sp.]|nr:T9SS type A sorting domain-containing protein [Crocinitomix sp.]
MKRYSIFIILFLLQSNLFAQITFENDTWEPIGNTQLRERYDDIDNMDGLNDGAIMVDGQDTIGPLGVLYTFQGTMELDETFHIETYTYKYNGSYVKYFIELYNLTDEVILNSSPLITHGTFDTPVESVLTILDYAAIASDAGDVLQLRYVRENTVASNHVARDFAIDNFSLNGSEIAAFDQVFAPKPYLDITPLTPTGSELLEMGQILADMSDLMLGTEPPTVEDLLDAVADYDAQEIIVAGENITGIEHLSKSDWGQAAFLKVFAQHLKFSPDDPTVYPNGWTLQEMAVHTIWLFSDQYYKGEIPFDYINYSYKLYAGPAAFLIPLLDERRYNLFYYTLYMHSRKMVYYWSPTYITGIANTGAINEDDIYNISGIQLVFGLMQETPVEQLQWTKCFKRYYERFMSFSPGTSDGMKPDGASFHHYSALNNYTYCYNTPSKILPILQGTSFQISEDAYKNLRRAVYGQLMVANDNVEPLGMSGRHPQARQIAPNSNDIRALAIVGGDILELGGPDPILAGAYIRHWGPHADFPDDGAETLSGFIQMNYHTGGVYWKDDWMISTRGQTNWGFGAEFAIDSAHPESSLNRNIYGRYQSYGTLEVIYTGGQALGNGFTPDTWNWNYNPGATTIVLPWDLLKVENSVGQREFQRNGFTGTLAFDRLEHDALSKTYGNYGLFGMDFLESTENQGFSLGDPNNHDSTFTFKKSVFFFEDFILSLGSGIYNETESHKTVTTLFQRSSFFFSTVIVEDEVYEDFGSSIFETSADHWLIDNYNTGYYVVAGSDDIILQRELQQIPQYDQYDHTLAESNPASDVTIAYLDHGTNPTAAAYEFLVFPNTAPSDMTDFSESMSDPETKPYAIIQKDNNAHIAHDVSHNILGYSLFSSNTNLDNEHLVKSNDIPCLIMYKQINPIRVQLSLSNPYLGFHYRSFDSSAVVPILITMRGVWDLETPQPDVIRVDFTDSTSTFEFDSFDGLPIEVFLIKSDLSISESNINIELFPNPTKSHLNIRSDTPINRVRIIDASGKTMMCTLINSSINVANLAPGTYTLEMETEGGIIIRRFTKMP